MAQFFVSCQLGLEKELAVEIKKFWTRMIDLDGQPTRVQMPEFEEVEGGLQFEINEYLGYQINLFSKLANRVLQRINKFEARYFDQFEEGIRKIEFEKILDLDLLQRKVQLKIEAHKSRLNNEKNLTEAFSNAVKSKNIKVEDKAQQTIFIRITKDRVTVSLDTSGEHLHKRGYAEHRGEAPLRETLAAYLITKLQQHSAIDKSLIFLDPFAGSGTLIFEALTASIPNLNRHYSFLSFKSAPKLYKSETWRKNYRDLPQEHLAHFIGCDLDEKVVKSFKHNLELVQSKFGLKNVNVKILNQDSQNLDIAKVNDSEKVWIVTNPPYGVRLSDENTKSLIQKLGKKVEGLILIHPAVWNLKFDSLKLVQSEDFNNQGLKLKLSIYKLTGNN
jgi:putative N6-adenine-specific DNA methylase